MDYTDNLFADVEIADVQAVCDLAAAQFAIEGLCDALHPLHLAVDRPDDAATQEQLAAVMACAEKRGVRPSEPESEAFRAACALLASGTYLRRLDPPATEISERRPS